MIKVKGITHKVVPLLVGDQPLEYMPLGQIQQLNATIGILMEGTDPQVQKESLIHEIIHACSGSEDISEEVVSRVSENLYAVLVDNDLLREDWWDKIFDEFAEGIRSIHVGHEVRELDGTAEEGVAG